MVDDFIVDFIRFNDGAVMLHGGGFEELPIFGSKLNVDGIKSISDSFFDGFFDGVIGFLVECAVYLVDDGYADK